MSDLRTTEEIRDGGVTLLGNHNVKYENKYNPNILETFVNKHPGNDYWVKFNCVEGTSLCPITGQPDYFSAYISYIPNVDMVESKSLKLYIFSFRNQGDYHEDITNLIMKDLIAKMNPKYIEVWCKFLPRGGISIDPFVNYSNGEEKYDKIRDYRFLNHDMNPEKIDNR